MSHTTQPQTHKKYYIYYDIAGGDFEPSVSSMPVYDDDTGLVMAFDKEEMAKYYCDGINVETAGDNPATRKVYNYLGCKEPNFYIEFLDGDVWEACGIDPDDPGSVPWGGYADGNNLYFTDEYLASAYCAEMEYKNQGTYRYIIVA